MIPAPQPPYDRPTAYRRHLRAFATVAALSSLTAFVVGGLQSTALGDDPFAMLGCGCFIAGSAGAKPHGQPVLLGLLAMVGFPVWALVDLRMHGGHSLLPIEFAFYVVYGGLGVAVACIARWRSRRRSRAP